jgi:hypothetical protein
MSKSAKKNYKNYKILRIQTSILIEKFFNVIDPNFIFPVYVSSIIPASVYMNPIKELRLKDNTKVKYRIK